MSAHRRRVKVDLPAYASAMNRAHVGEGPDPDCKDHSDEFVDYEMRDMPNEELAALLCSRCPFKTGHGKPGDADYIPVDVCLANARHRKPSHGVYGGRVFINGRQAALMPTDDARLMEFVD